MQTINLKNNWLLVVLKNVDESPMLNHAKMAMAADDENRRIYAYEMLVAVYGLESVKKSCNKYATTRGN